MGFQAPTAAAIVAWADHAAAQTGLSDIRNHLTGLLGGWPEVELTIASGAVAMNNGGSPNEPVSKATIDTESDDATDTLTNATVAGTHVDGQYVILGLENSARVVTITHEAGGAGQLSFRDSLDLVLWKTTQWVLFYVDIAATPDTLREVARFGFDTSHDTRIDKTGDFTILDYQDGSTFGNLGAAGAVTLTLPTARVGLEFTIYVAAAQTLNVAPGGSDEIMLAGVASSTGYWANAVGEFIHIKAVDAVTWLAIGDAGTWTAI